MAALRRKEAFFVKRVRGNRWRFGKADFAKWGAASTSKRNRACHRSASGIYV